MSSPRASTICLLAAAVATLAAGCGSSAKRPPSLAGAASTVAGASTSTEVSSTASAAAPATPGAGSQGAGSPQGGAGGGTPAQAPSRTAPAPAFVHGQSASAELASAVAVLSAHGYEPADTSQYRPEQSLRVLVGRRTGTAGGYQQQAFFFLGGRYLGTDASQPSASVTVLGQEDTAVTLAYPRFRASDPSCCPSGGQTQVRFALNNGRLAPLQAIPPLSSRR